LCKSKFEIEFETSIKLEVPHAIFYLRVFGLVKNQMHN
jgi:hypothetical protein